MYFMAMIKGNDLPSGCPNPGEAVLDETIAVDIWGTKFSEPGPDKCVVRFLGEEGKVLATREIPGY